MDVEEVWNEPQVGGTVWVRISHLIAFQSARPNATLRLDDIMTKEVSDEQFELEVLEVLSATTKVELDEQVDELEQSHVAFILDGDEQSPAQLVRSARQRQLSGTLREPKQYNTIHQPAR